MSNNKKEFVRLTVKDGVLKVKKDSVICASYVCEDMASNEELVTGKIDHNLHPRYTVRCFLTTGAVVGDEVESEEIAKAFVSQF